jgi:LCP family protein required for cell wall assembly
MDFQPRPRRNTNIDGFSRPQKKQTHAFYLRRAEEAQKPAPIVASPPLAVPKPMPIVPEFEAIPIDSDTKFEFNPNPLSKRRWKKRIIRSSLSFVMLLVLVGGWVGFQLLHNVNKVFHGSIVSDVKALSSQTVLNGESTGRVNILLAGDSADQIGHGGADLTDSILILSIDTTNHTAFLLSIPRDLWVYMPGSTYPGGTWQKINAANDLTSFNQPGYPAGGMGALSYIVQNDLGIPVNYYGLMDYGAFEAAVDAVGGVSLNIQSPDPRGLYDPNTNLKLPNGIVALDGQQALNLARARGDGYGSYGFPNSDFDRTQHQRQLFVAVAEKAKTLGVVSNPIKVSNLFSAFGNNLQTSLTLNDVLSLIDLTKNINPSAIQSYAYSATLSGSTTPLLENYQDPASGEDALIPTAGLGNYGQMENYYKQLTSTNPIVKEDPTVEILNGSEVVGLAAHESSILTADGYDVVGVTDAHNEYPGSMIVDQSNGQDPAADALLQKTYGSATTVVTSATGSSEAGEAQGYTANFVVVLGDNWDGTVIPTATPSSSSSTTN